MRPALGAPCLALLQRWPALLTAGARWAGKVRCAPGLETVGWLAHGVRPGRASLALAPRLMCMPPELKKESANDHHF